MLASCDVVDVHELQHVYVALVFELFGPSASNRGCSFTDLSWLSVNDFAFGEDYPDLFY